jgi:DNA-directed RNA polymerase subunit M/transcription elongation factor TFIIS
MDTTMKFCPTCDNLFYLTIDEETVQYTCKKCGTIEDINEDCTISNIFCNQQRQNVKNSVNQYTKLDPTLPRINFMKCPNASCENHEEREDREIIYVRYDNVQLKYIYICPKCDTVWESGIKIDIKK